MSNDLPRDSDSFSEDPANADHQARGLMRAADQAGLGRVGNDLSGVHRRDPEQSDSTRLGSAFEQHRMVASQFAARLSDCLEHPCQCDVVGIDPVRLDDASERSVINEILRNDFPAGVCLICGDREPTGVAAASIAFDSRLASVWVERILGASPEFFLSGTGVGDERAWTGMDRQLLMRVVRVFCESWEPAWKQGGDALRSMMDATPLRIDPAEYSSDPSPGDRGVASDCGGIRTLMSCESFGIRGAIACCMPESELKSANR